VVQIHFIFRSKGERIEAKARMQGMSKLQRGDFSGGKAASVGFEKNQMVR